MKFSVCFIQCQHKLQLPHMNMPLFVPDLEAADCRVRCICVNAARLSELARLLSEQHFDLLAIEHMAPYGIVRRVKASSPDTKIVVGGNGFLDIFTKTEVDFGIVGAGRDSLRALVSALQGKMPIEEVPNLFYKRSTAEGSVIDCTAGTIDLSLTRELRPFTPMVDWEYLGFRGPTPALSERGAPPTLVADLGCPCRVKAPAGNEADLELHSTRYSFTDAARSRFAGLREQRLTGGCSFCTYGLYAGAPLNVTLELLLEQMTYLQETYGFDRFAIGSEQPFRFLQQLLQQTLERGLTLRQLRIRSRVEWVLRSQKTLREALEMAREKGFQIALWQVGFESFSDRHLSIYAKEQSVEQNIEAIHVLEKLAQDYEGYFASSVPSHGFLGNTAWTTPEDIEEQMLNLGPLPRCWRRAILGGPVKIFDELLPYAQRLKRDGLLVPRRDSRSGFRFADERTRLVERIREYYVRKSRKLTNAFFWRAALDAYWDFLGELVADLKSKDESLPHPERDLVRAKKLIDRKVDPILDAHRLYCRGARAESRHKFGEALQCYGEANQCLPENGAILAAMSRAAHELDKMSQAAGYAKMAVPLLEVDRRDYADDPNIDLLLAQCLARMGDLAQVGAYLRAGSLKRRCVMADGD
ncbi:MAG: hypothetical protein KJ626_07810 [Verrucomicrobia bacterium]|nr:hypothetical protein [Verrucomicrobiota bacterium]